MSSWLIHIYIGLSVCFALVIFLQSLSDKLPVLALYLDGEKEGFFQLKQAEALCIDSGVEFLCINDHISINKINAMVYPFGTSRLLELDHWINTKTNMRHNASCRWYGNKTNGRACKKREGWTCKACGG